MKLTAKELEIRNETLSEKELDKVNGGYILLPIPIFKEVGKWIVNKLNLRKPMPQKVIAQQ